MCVFTFTNEKDMGSGQSRLREFVLAGTIPSMLENSPIRLSH